MSTSRWLTWTPATSIRKETSEPELTKPTKANFDSFVRSPLELFQRIEQPETRKHNPDVGRNPVHQGDAGSREGVSTLPHCPRCGSYYLYRRNNVGNFECVSCELRDIPAKVAGRVQ
jgi:hypothetical protein